MGTRSRGCCASTSTRARRAQPATADLPAGDVAVTKPRRRRPRWTRISKRLPWLAAGLGAFAARDLHGQSSAEARFLFYQESGGRTQVLDPVVLWRQDLGASNGAFSLLLGYDAISGASPTGAYPTSDV